MARIVYIGAPEADADRFAAQARLDFPDIDLFASNDRAHALEHLAHTEVLIGHHFHFDEQMLAGAPKLRWIQSLTSGADAILNLPSLRQDVLVTSTRGIHGPQMSELVFLHMLALTRDFVRILSNQQAARWERWPQPLLAGKTVVIVGVGSISEALAARCRAFGMTVYGVSSSQHTVPGFDRIFSRPQLQQAAALADYLILLVPLSADTANLVDASVLRAMKSTAYLINVARGGVLDEQALLAAVRAQRLAGASLDVFRQTPLPATHPLWHQDRILITPHLGGMSDVYLQQCYSIVRANLQNFLAGRTDEMLNVVAH